MPEAAAPRTPAPARMPGPATARHRSRTAVLVLRPPPQQGQHRQPNQEPVRRTPRPQPAGAAKSEGLCQLIG
jgi:hypothetical protein